MGSTSASTEVGSSTTPLEADWIAAARKLLIERGISAVQVTTLAAALGVTRGGFYWRFRNRADLLEQLLEDWRERNTRPMLKVLQGPGSPAERYQKLVRMWIDETQFDPALDSAVRRWGGDDPAVAPIVREVDNTRIAALTQLFVAAGQEDVEAMVRARIVYFHQVGYYALRLVESRERREELMPMYTKLLTGLNTAD